MTKNITLALILCAMGGGYGLKAESNVYDLGQIEVVADSIDENRTVQTMEQKELEDLNIKNLAESLSYTSGIDYTPASGSRGEPSFSMRGYDLGQVGIFIDGIPMYSIYDKQTDWSQFVIFDASQIQISKGYTSMLYGPNTMGGAVNLVTRKPKDKLELAFKAQYQTPNQHLEYASIGTNLGLFYAQFSFSNLMRDYYNLSNNFNTTSYQPNRHRVNSYYSNQHFSLKLGVTPNSTDEYSLNVMYSMGKKGGLTSTKSNSRFWDWPHYDKLTAYFLSKTRFADFITLNTKVFYDTFYNELTMRGQLQNSGVISGNPTGTSIYDDWTLGAGIGLNFDFTPQDLLKFSVLIKSDNHDNSDGPTSPDIGQSDLTSYVSAEYTRIFSENIRAALSLSYTRNDMLMAEVLNGSQIQKDAKSSLWGIGAQAIVYVDILDNLDTYITAGKKDNVPTLKDRYSTTWGQRVPNPNLTTESAINMELGINYYPLDTLHLSFATFYNDLTDMIVSQNLADNTCSAGSKCYRLENVASGYSTGFEVGLEYEIIDSLSLNANYTYMIKRAKDSSVITNFPNHLANARITYSPISDLDLVLGIRYSSSRIVSSATASGTYIDSPNVFLANIRVAYRPIEGLELALGVDNLFDNNYWYSDGYEMQGRSVYVEAGYKF